MAVKQNPIVKLFGLAVDSQNQLKQIQGILANPREKDGSINPGTLLLVQTKLAQAQQKLEYASVLLSKAVDAIKQLFNIQI